MGMKIPYCCCFFTYLYSYCIFKYIWNIRLVSDPPRPMQFVVIFIKLDSSLSLSPCSMIPLRKVLTCRMTITSYDDLYHLLMLITLTKSSYGIPEAPALIVVDFCTVPGPEWRRYATKSKESLVIIILLL